MIKISDIYREGPREGKSSGQSLPLDPPPAKAPEEQKRSADPESAYNRALLTARTSIEGVRETGQLDITDDDLAAISNILFLVEKERANMQALFYENTPSDYLYAHTVNVCVLSLILASHMVYNRDQLIKLAIASFFHDIGMSFYRDIYDKNETLTGKERAIVEQHVVRGRDLILTCVRFSDDLRNQIADIIYQHHERVNGSGYPEGIGAADISNFAKVIAVSDIYETLTHDRPWRPAVSGAKAMEIILGYRDNVSPDTVRIILNELSVYPQGSVVKLNDGRRARVIEINHQALTCPKVEVIEDGTVEGSDIIDLSKQKLFCIEDIE